MPDTTFHIRLDKMLFDQAEREMSLDEQIKHLSQEGWEDMRAKSEALRVKFACSW